MELGISLCFHSVVKCDGQYVIDEQIEGNVSLQDIVSDSDRLTTGSTFTLRMETRTLSIATLSQPFSTTSRRETMLQHKLSQI